MRKEVKAGILGIGLAIIPGAQALAQDRAQIITGDGLIVCPDPKAKMELDLSLPEGKNLQIGENPNALILSPISDGVVVARRQVNGQPIEVFRFGGNRNIDKPALLAGTTFIENPDHTDGLFRYKIEAGRSSKDKSGATLSVTVKCN